VESGVQDVVSDVTTHPAPHSQPARVSTSASARTVPAGCDDLTAQNGDAVVADAVGLVVG
jgi:regulator of RNase E activity RraA